MNASVHPLNESASSRQPGVVILATGGTIAGSSADPTDTTRYAVGALEVGALIDAVPGLREMARLSAEQVVNVPSSDIDQGVLLRLAAAVNGRLADAQVDGVVVTHGTDTLEETAFFLDLTTQGSDKPVVLVGAMRPATALSADGPLNLLQAVALAASPQARGRGTMVVMNDRIESAYYTTKTSTTAVDAFQAAEPGSLGMFLGARPHFYYSPATPVGRARFDVSGLDTLPKVAIIYMHEGQDSEQMDMAIERGARGIVLAGNGAGSVAARMKPRLTQLTRQGFPVVRASRTGSGFAVKEDGGGVASGALNPQKSRILLMLALAMGADLARIRQLFAWP
ncbi:MAG: L-asparaginase [Paracidovorax wautersii]|uniref:L-asparaginase n=1 Tax=Paracidovorax wautersii TaxID=1177982 RepID=A0A7V8JPR7_9BURK|nr:MAG: L-asparaginase [Paracidovorax wautersii]